MEKNAVDRYISEHLHDGMTPREQAVQAFQNRANKLEADVNPLFTVAQRRAELLKEESVYNDNAEKNLAAGYFLINPYSDPPFKKSVQRSAHELCCAIKTDRDWIVHIQDRVAKGLPPLESDSNQAPADMPRRQTAPPPAPSGGGLSNGAINNGGPPRFRGNPELRKQRRRQRLEKLRERREQLQKEQEQKQKEAQEKQKEQQEQQPEQGQPKEQPKQEQAPAPQ